MIPYLQKKNLLCHDLNVKIEKNRKIICNSCENEIFNVDQFVTEAPFLESCQVAHLYARWTGDVHVLCKIQLSGIPGIFPTNNLLIPYSNLMKGIELLGITNQEFIATQHYFNKSQVLQKRILENFFNEYMEMVSHLEYEDESLQNIIPSLLKEMNSVFKESNVFDFFLNVMCPYVKSCEPDFKPVTSHCDAHTPGELLMHLSKNATLIREKFSKYCIPFDVVYIMIYCYLCFRDPDMVANFVFDMIAKICNRYFDMPTHYQQTLLQAADQHISITEKLQLYYMKSRIESGEVKEYLSVEFLEKYGEMQQILSQEFDKRVTAPTEQIRQYAFSQTFPYALFPNVANYNGFICALGYLTKKMVESNKNLYQKGVFSNAKFIFKTVEEYTLKISDFCKENSVPYFTSEIFKMFLSADQDLLPTFFTLIQMLSGSFEN